MFQDFPSLHPLAIHFPIVLILLATAFQAVLVFKDWDQIRWVTLFIMASAFFSALAASTLFHADPSEDAPQAAMKMFEEHERFAQLTLWMSGITLLLKCIGVFFKIKKRPYDILVLVSSIIASIFLTIAGHHGARLTHIAGIGPMGKFLMKEHDMDNHNMKKMDNMQMNENDTLKKKNKIIEGDTSNMSNEMDMSEMKIMDSKSKVMKPMKNMKSNDMKSMKMEGGNMPEMKNMDSKSKEMKPMKGNDMKSMKMDGNIMSDMKNMDSKSKEMKPMKMEEHNAKTKGMDSTMNMGNMNMEVPKKNVLDTFHFQDNNPALKKIKKPIIH